MLRAVSSNLRPDAWTFEVETLAVLDMAGFLFSFGIRLFFGFGILVSVASCCSSLSVAVWKCVTGYKLPDPCNGMLQCFWLLGPIALVVSTTAFLAGLFMVDFLPTSEQQGLIALQEAQRKRDASGT